MDIYAGFSRVPITPARSMRMAGFDQRTQLSEGVHDELYASCLVLKTPEGSLVMVSLDILGVDEPLSDAIRARIRETGGESGECEIFVCATHNHSGPSGIFRGRTNYDAAYVDYLVRQSTESFREAMDSLEPSQVTGGTVPVADIASRRNNPTDRSPLLCGWLGIENRRDKIRVVNFPCHMTVLNEANRFFSRDMLLGVQEEFSRRGISALLYINGAAGDISTRFTKRDSSFEEARRLGRMLAQNVLRAEENASFHWAPAFWRRKALAFSAVYRRPLTADEKTARRREIEDALCRTEDRGQRRDLQSALLVLARPDRKPETIPGAVAAEGRVTKQVGIRLAVLGNLALVSIPFELYYDIGIRIQQILLQKYPGAQILLAGYCGGYNGYIPPAGAFSGISYETEAALFEPDTESRLLEAVENL